MNRALAIVGVAILSGAAGGCCCLRDRCPEPCPPPCAPCAPAIGGPCPPAVGAPVIPAPGGTYVPVPSQGAVPRRETADGGPLAVIGRPVSTVVETLRSWTVPPRDTRPFGLNPSAPARPLAVTQ
jgi:hypothetical protein